MEVKNCEKEKWSYLGHEKSFDNIATILHIKNFLCQTGKEFGELKVRGKLKNLNVLLTSTGISIKGIYNIEI
ncbi:hypothetical protein MM236_19275 [Belliella sp. DSM 107340]|uniref:Uncharacterized protein n=1 Tax=Belliella calami TaxID=2923436 RepID=A0ABS9UUF9_9BACT|nr:hypothetical protein [Belliella calami]MCH7400144.1 hypothetical protein [Belliella calami]